MEGVRQKCRPKHQVLVLKCYPQYQKGVQVVKPNSSELSYLLYYVSTRRSKLTKVGAFLEKRAARDVWRRKIGNVQVTLQILSALIEKVPRDLPIYARSVMTVLETVVRSQDISMVEDSIETFETFCRHQDMAALSAEQDFATQYREVVRSYAGFAEGDPSTQSKLAAGPPLTVRWKTAGLRAIKGVVSSEAGLAADGGDSIRVILPVILENLYSPEDNLVSSLELKLLEADKSESETAHRRRVSTATVETVDAVEGDASLAAQNTADVDRQAEMDMRLLALRCLEQIVVNGSSRGQIRVTTQVVLDFILRKSRVTGNGLGQNHKDSWATSLIELIAKWCPVQVRFIILLAAMDILHDIPPTEESLDESFAITYLIDRLLKSPVNMIGLSVIDVLLGLLRHMSFLISPSRAGKSTPDEKQNGHSTALELSVKRTEVLSLLQDCIGNLTTHIYYGEQVVDMVRTILTRFRPSRGNEQAITSSPTQSDALGGASAMMSSGEGGPIAFSLPSAKITALRAIKNILLVANTKRPGFTVTTESRHQVGLYVWEGTQWLLSEPDRDVRYAYVDAFLTWLKLETSTDDLKVKERTGRPASQPAKNDLLDPTERPGKRTASMSGNQREKVILIAQSSFLRLLHLTIFDVATDHPTSVSEIMLLHLLLVSLVKHLGVNAVRFGLPMVLKLQDNMTTADGQSFPALVNIGSLVYGYLWALSEKFDLDTSKIGNGIQSEVQKRQQLGVWLETIRLPPVNLDKIIQNSNVQASGRGAQDVSLLIPFDGGEELIQRIEASYGSFITLLTHSPPSSPGSVGSPPRSITAPVLPHVSASAATPKANVLPPAVREQMLSPWSREACLAAAENERAEAKSLSGSRAGTLVMRNHVHQNGTSSPSASSNASVPQSAYASAAGLQNAGRMSVPNSSGSQLISTSRESPVHVNELRRVLSVNEEGKARRMSPLRGRLDGSNRSVISSSSDSMVSGYSLSEFDDGASVKPQSTRGGRISFDGEETPRASALSFMADTDDIPPVPPIPPSISIQGGLSDGRQRSFSASRPSTAPGLRRPSVTNGKAGTPGTSPGRSLSRDKSRSSTGLAAAATDGVGPYAEKIDSARLDVQKLLDGFLSPADAETRGSRRKARSNTGRRGVSGGLGRPPY
ncbi:protein efr3 [Aspergillus transmontanensis]|uniref:Protein efr3 n=1 Tax=Aspergillus transmontanensis TaxID=1034304 RepID=A0A5N6WCF4_9EURO|nr:protein efr3 [Aspergillus transmontanensis]